MSKYTRGLIHQILVPLIAISILGCGAPSRLEDEETGAPQIGDTSHASLPADTIGPSPSQMKPTEFLEWQHIKINGQIPLATSVHEVEALFGKRDSVLVPDYEEICPNCHFCGEQIPAFQDVYYKGLEFEQLQDSLVFWSADFSANKELFLQIGELRLSHNTTLKAIQKQFPQAYEERRVEETGVTIGVSPSANLTDGMFYMDFDSNGILIKFHYWFPC